MKKNRPATKISVLCTPGQEEALERILFSEGMTIGIRRWTADRHKLSRESIQVETAWGLVQAKRVTLPDGSQRIVPEYDDCRRLAVENGIALQAVLAGVSRSS